MLPRVMNIVRRHVVAAGDYVWLVMCEYEPPGLRSCDQRRSDHLNQQSAEQSSARRRGKSEEPGPVVTLLLAPEITSGWSKFSSLVWRYETQFCSVKIYLSEFNLFVRKL